MTSPADQAAELVKWLRDVIGQRMGLARHAIESEACVAEWTELCSGVLVTGPPSHDDPWDGTHPLGDSRLTRLMADNDPRDVIARCDGELAILDALDHRKKYDARAEAAFRKWKRSSLGHAQRPGMGIPWADVLGEPCLFQDVDTLEWAARQIATGYQHWPGWRAKWKP